MAATLALIVELLTPQGSGAASGVVVEELGQDSALIQAGIRPGDVLTDWERSPTDRGEIASPFDWEWVAIEQAPRGPIRLIGQRQGKALSASVTQDIWDATVRPRLPAEIGTLYEQGRRQIAAGEIEQGLDSWRQAVEGTRGTDERLSCWLLFRMALTQTEARAFEEARAIYGEALELARDAMARSMIHSAVASLHERQNALESAYNACYEAFEIREARWGRSLATAQALHRLSHAASVRGDYDLAERHLGRALEIIAESAPRSYRFSLTLIDLGRLAFHQGRIAEAGDHFRRSQEVLRETAPSSPGMVRALSQLGAVARAGGRLAAAEELYLEARTLLLERPPVEATHLGLASVSGYLSNVARDRGDYDLAEKHARYALETWEGLRPGSFNTGAFRMILANIAADRGELEQAAEIYREALATFGSLSHDHLVASTLNNLGTVFAEKGAFPLAESHFQRALAIYERLGIEGFDTAHTLQNLGDLTADRGGDLELARDYYGKALAIFEKEAPEGIGVAVSSAGMGRLLTRTGQLDKAETFYLRALGIYEKYSAHSLYKARAQHGLGLLYRRQGRLEETVRTLERALDTLEDQVDRLGGSRRIEEGFRSVHRVLYGDALRGYLELGRPAAAFHVLERSRAQSFLAMLAERDLLFIGDLPSEIEEARRNLATRSDRLLLRMEEAERAGQSVEEHLRAAAALRQQRDALELAIRKASPRFADLRHPRPLTLAEARESLDPGTVVLAYSVGSETTELFVIDRVQGLSGVVSLDLGEEELRRKVVAFRRLVDQRRDAGSPFFRALEDAGGELFEALIAPASAAIESSVRLLVLPDGPLHLLPFAALRRPGARYLVEWKPFSTVLSLTLYAELRQRRSTSGVDQSPVALVAFGDPHYTEKLSEASHTGADFRVRSAVRRGLFDWRPLPYTRREIERIGALFAPHEVRLHLGEDATEEAVKAVSEPTRIVHFAVHGHLDDRFPLNSALVLSIPEAPAEDRENGLLQVWEIFESVRLEADLAVLSACESALGQERGGEGLTGLVRAFQYAGAGNVAASLWSVEDQATADLMTRFYRHLRAGHSYDEALRAAQLELLHVPDRLGRATSAPYYWAAFQIFGAGL